MHNPLAFRIHFIIPVLLFFSRHYAHSQQWQRVTELPAAQMSDILVRGDSLYAAGPNKLYYSYDGGNTWDSTAVIDPSLDYIPDVIVAGDRLYVATANDGVRISTDDGLHWTDDSNGLSGLGASSVSGFTIRGDSLYAGTYGAGVFVKKISNNSMWSPYNLGMPWGNIESIAHIDGRLFAGAGANGTVSQQVLPNHNWLETPFDAFTGLENFFLGVVRQDDVLLAAGTSRLYRSTDQGATWTSYNAGTGYLGLARFAANEQRMYAQLAKPSGFAYILYTDDQGLSWNNFEPVLAGSAGFDIAVCNGWLYSARGNGLWRIALTTSSREPVVEMPELGQNFPNPFSGHTTIPYILKQNETVNLSVFNAAGTLVWSVRQEELPVGAYQIGFDAAGLPPGAYIYRLCGNSGETSRIMLIKN